MVDALIRAGRWVRRPHGRLIDLRPAEVVPDIELGLPDGSTLHVGVPTVSPSRAERHRAAAAAVRSLVGTGSLRVENESTFDFHRYAESADELRDYIATTWHHSRVDDATHARAVELLGRHRGARFWLRERVGIRTLVPLTA